MGGAGGGEVVRGSQRRRMQTRTVGRRRAVETVTDAWQPAP